MRRRTRFFKLHALTRPFSFARWVLGVLASIALIGSAYAQIDYPNRRASFTPGELAMLPPYCKNMQGFPGYDGPAGNRWRSMIGSDFQHIHHYCRGLRDLYYIKFGLPNPTQRTFLWQRAISEYDYMIKNSSRTMPLLPEILLRRGEALVVLGRLPEAEESFRSARNLKPDYLPPYTAWADQLIRLKLFERAQELLLEGLQNAPPSALTKAADPQVEAIFERLGRLPEGGKLVDQARKDRSAAASAEKAPGVSSAAASSVVLTAPPTQPAASAAEASGAAPASAPASQP